MTRLTSWILSLLIVFGNGGIASYLATATLTTALVGFVQGGPPEFTEPPPSVDEGPDPARLEQRTDQMWDAATLEYLGAMQQIQQDSSLSLPEAAAVDYEIPPPEEEPGGFGMSGFGGGEPGTTAGGTGGSTGGTTGGSTGGTTGGTTGGSTGGTTGGSTGGSTGGTAGDGGGGGGFPWEGYGPGGGSGSAPGVVNTNTGNRHTEVPLVGWNGRGGADIEFSLMHDSRGFGAQFMPKGWRSSYDMWVYQAGLPVQQGVKLTAIVHWPDGTSVPYTQASAGSSYYTGPPGIYEKLQRVSTGWRLTTKSLDVYEFGTTGYLNSMRDRHWNTIFIGRWTNGRRIDQVSDQSGRWLTLNYTNDVLSSVTDTLARTWTLSVNGSQQMVGLTYPLLTGGASTRTFTYDANNCLSSETDLRGKTWTMTHDSSKRLTSLRDPLSNEVVYNYFGAYTTYSLPAGGQVRHNYSTGRLVSDIDPSAYAENYGYDSNRNLSTIRDRRGKTWSYKFDARGNVLETFSPLRPATIGIPMDTYTYNSKDQVLTHKNALGRFTTYAYDGTGSLLNVKNDASSIIQTFTYDSYGQVLSETGIHKGPGEAKTFEYDAYGNVSAAIDALGNRTTVERNSLGWVLSVTKPLVGTTNAEYDGWGRLTGVRYPDNNTVSVEYDEEDNVLAVSDELQRRSTFSYDDAGRQISSSNPRGDTELVTLNGNGWTTAVRNGRGYTRNYAYTLRGDLKRLELPDGTIEQWSFDGAGNTTLRTNPLGQPIGSVYDPNGRLTLVDYPTGTDTALQYNLLDQPTQMTDASGTTQWAYNSLHQLGTLTTPQGSLVYTYDGLYRQATMKQGTQTASVYTYDSAGRLATLKNPFNETTGWEYDSLHRATRQTYSTGSYADYGYDGRSRLNTLVHKTSAGVTLTSEAYNYNAASSLLSKTVDTVATTYTYDLADQLLSETRPGAAVTYTYDANGNRTSKTVNGATDVYTYDAGDKLLTAGAKNFTYDAAGRTKSVTVGGQTTLLDYDFEDRLVRITHPGGAQSNYAYNGAGARTSKVTSAGTRTFRRDGVGVTSPVLRDGVADYTPGISERRGSTTKLQHTDRLGSTTRLTGTNQVVTDTRSYDAFGMLVGTSGSTPTPFGFAGDWGYQTDTESGLQLLGHRYYDPSLGRFLTRDPIQDGRNWYAYCENNPLKGVDPAGLQKVIVRGNDSEIETASGIGYPLWRPSFDPDAGDIELVKPSKRILMELMFECDEFYFWGHGTGKGSLWINDTEYLTQGDLDIIERERKKRGKGKMKLIVLASCNSAASNDWVNNWLDLTEELSAHCGLTAVAWPPRINRPKTFKTPLPAAGRGATGPAPTGKKKGKGKE